MEPNLDITQRTNEPSPDRLIYKQRHLLRFTVTAIIFMLICVESAAADQGAFFVNKWGNQGYPHDQLEGPSGIAMDSSGYIYVADRGHNLIKKFKPNGDLVEQWGGSGSADGQFINPRGIAVDSWDNVYVADEGNHRIQKFDSSGTHLQSFGTYGTGNRQFKYPFAVAVWGDKIYVADTYNDRIQKFQTAPLVGWPPQFKTAWGTSGPVDLRLKKPRGIAVDNTGNVYVADSENHRIMKFDITDGFIDQWGSFGDGNSQLKYPRGVAVDGNGVVYVADYYNHRIQKFLSSGIQLATWGGEGQEDGQFRFPTFVAVYNTCTIAVSDTTNNRVQKFACDNSTFYDKWGHQGTENGEFNRPMGIAVDRSGNVYVADTNNHRIQKFTSTGTFLNTWGRLGAGEQEFNHPTSVAVDREGFIYVADRDNNRIQKLNSTGQFVDNWSSGPYYGDELLHHPTSVSVDNSGDIYVVDEAKVWKFTKMGTFIDSLGPSDDSNLGSLYPRTVLPVTTGYFDAIYVTTDGLGNVPPGIRKYRATGIYDAISGYQCIGQQEGTFYGLAVDSDQNFYSFNSSNDRIQKFTSFFFKIPKSSFGYLHEWGGSGSGNGQFNHPSGIAVDKNFNVYVVDAENHRIQKFSVVGCMTCSLWR